MNSRILPVLHFEFSKKSRAASPTKLHAKLHLAPLGMGEHTELSLALPSASMQTHQKPLKAPKPPKKGCRSEQRAARCLFKQGSRAHECKSHRERLLRCLEQAGLFKESLESLAYREDSDHEDRGVTGYDE